MSTRQQRAAQKASLLEEIHQQRRALHHSSQEWLAATAPLDRGWLRIQHLQTWLVAGSSLMALWGVRHPRFLGRTVKRGIGLWSSWRLIRKALRLTRR
ncbi:YqjK-like family protein [Shimwellia blattae]|uniref:Cell division protein MukB-like protein n=1 Tax=Shimwellia blattae (strain ATCC 29907 / DSM 4481 / JCM 1650 / NBRC 105725 / CDC 9005-74) TaxID=630626 RepID=I2B4X6_SHIBC|nr:YqjK-like family protein [Shimwellia blattae]AFJ45580.1 cell division protein MukB-like protein [Shimwellia blattae DSM 4481 = NBRC 105725]GAB81480.1 hypothetical protein YqjK [Shimwellia blattae DSM 4481 = NBRC 105725]VDY63061.1 Uncharacterised protein [Shimwellia blattae]VEC20223.1 Uncharacterised protein [Shimwellia blattae]